ncbi:monocarboxylate transporter 13-like [Haliotis asinina]|uniref:monocarboxylate transporter 13-like n=1 Tax=Haliotis asinina TaxID=109174 RepID=UPI003531DEC4
MKEESKASFDVALSAVGGQFGHSVEGPFGVIEQHEAFKNPDESTVTPAPDGGRGWIILLVACLLLSATSIYRALQPASISVPQRHETTTQAITTSTVNGDLGLQPTSAPPDGSPGTGGKYVPPSSGGGLISSVDLVLMVTNLNQLMNMFNAGDNSIVQNITSILFALNKPDLAEKVLEVYRNRLVQTSPVVTTVVATNGVFSSVFGVFSSALILVFGYRCTAVAGSLVVGLGILGSYFCDHSNVVLISFLYGALTGIGQNMMYVSSFSAVLEYFKRRRLIALALVSIGNLLVIVPFVVLMVLVFPSAGMANSRSYFIMQFAVTGLLIPVSLMLKPLHLRMKGPVGGSLVSRQLGIQNLTIYKKPVLYTVTVTFFFWEGGYEIISKKLPGFKGLISIPNMADGLLLTLILSVAVLLGVCIAFCAGRCIRQRSAVIIFCVSCVSICFCSFLASQMNKEIYATVYSAVVGLLKGFTDPIILFTIPMFIGDNNISIGIGMVTVGQGLGKFLLPYLSDEIEGRTEKMDTPFYLVGGLYLMSCATMLVTYGIHKRAKIEDASRTKSDGKAAEPSATTSAVKVESPSRT